MTVMNASMVWIVCSPSTSARNDIKDGHNKHLGYLITKRKGSLVLVFISLARQLNVS